MKHPRAQKERMQVDVPATMLAEIDALVHAGHFASREAALAELLRLGLAVWRGQAPPMPQRPPMPPGRREPGDDRPISVDPSDVNWVE